MVISHTTMKVSTLLFWLVLFSTSSLAEENCSGLAWLDRKTPEIEGTHFYGFAEDRELEKAFKAAENDLWHNIYGANKEEGKFRSSDFSKPDGREPSPEEINNILKSFLSKVLVEVHRERKYEFLCGSYMVLTSIPKNSVGLGLRNRILLKEVIQFSLEGRQSQVDAEAKWLALWSKNALMVGEFQKQIIQAEDAANILQDEGFAGSLRVNLDKVKQEGRAKLYVIQHSRDVKEWSQAVNDAEIYNRRLLHLVAVANAYLDDEEEDAFQKLKDGQDNGSPEMQFLLGEAFEYGIGTTANFEKALPLFQRGVTTKFPMALKKLGHLHATGRMGADRIGEATEYLKDLAQSGDSLSQLDMAKVMVHLGQREQAMIWLDKALENNFAPALGYKGRLILEEESSTEDDKSKGIEYLRKASSLGDKETKAYIKKNKEMLLKILKKKKSVTKQEK